MEVRSVVTKRQLLLLFLMLLVIIISLSTSTSAARRKGQTRRRNKHRKVSMNEKLIPISPRLRAYYDHEDGAEIIKSSHFEHVYDLGHKIVLICVAQGDPLPAITWTKEGIEIFSHSFAHVTESRLPDNQVKSKLEIDPALQMDAGTYECQANNKYAIDRKTFKADFIV